MRAEAGLTIVAGTATVAIGKAGAKNAAILAVQILALSDKGLADKLVEFKKSQAKKVIEKDSEIRKSR
ncbi:MAG: AIR carboxylase family protein [Phycisphaerae bacterium]|nr:AIR carboxylase family protein [Phycisphaerae bacterium]